MSTRLYGVPLSQPFRSVAWTMLQLQIPFQVELTIPGASSRIGSKHENYKRLTPHETTQVPLLESTDPETREDIVLSESPAIMSYLCQANQAEALYPTRSAKEKATIDSYMHWHHGNTRFMAKLFQTKVRPDLKADWTEQDQERVVEILRSLDSGWLRSNAFIGGLERPTIADILAHGEISTVTMTKLINLEEYSHIYPCLASWMKRLSTLPFHEEAHRALITLGDLTRESPDADTPIAKRLGAATKAGLAGLNEAQTQYQ